MQLMSAALLVSVGETLVQGHQQMHAVLQMRLQAADGEQLLCEKWDCVQELRSPAFAPPLHSITL